MRRYWFPAKRFGWGWGPPCAWQGWIVLLAYFAAVAAAILVARPQRNLALFMLLATLATAVLLVICYLTGEPPAWRWGDRGDGQR